MAIVDELPTLIGDGEFAGLRVGRRVSPRDVNRRFGEALMVGVRVLFRKNGSEFLGKA